jgi:2'-5' RNA ligase
MKRERFGAAGSAPGAESGIARVFFALWPDEAVRRELAQAGRLLYGACGGRPTRPENLHLTLVFLGEVQRRRLDALREAAAAVRAPVHDLLLERLGWFRRNRVAWAGPAQTPAETLELVHGLESSLRQARFAFDARPYEAHITLVRKALCGEALPQIAAIRWTVQEFVLVESELNEGGSIYRIIGRWSL